MLRLCAKLSTSASRSSEDDWSGSRNGTETVRRKAANTWRWPCGTCRPCGVCARVYGTGDVLTLLVLDRLAWLLCQPVLDAAFMGREQADFVRSHFPHESLGVLASHVVEHASNHIAVTLNGANDRRIARAIAAATVGFFVGGLIRVVADAMLGRIRTRLAESWLSEAWSAFALWASARQPLRGNCKAGLPAEAAKDGGRCRD
jgi:hypothetical protein